MQSYPPPEIMQDVEETLKPEEVKDEDSNEPFDNSTRGVKGKRVSSETPTPVTPQSSLSPVTASETVERETAVVNSLSTTESSESSTGTAHGISINTTVTTTVPVPSKAPEVSKTPIATAEEASATGAQHASNLSVTSRRRKGRFGGTDGLAESDDGLLIAPQLKVQLPESLKEWLVDDWDLITRQARLFELPAAYPISSVVMDFLQHVANKEIKVECPDIDGMILDGPYPSSTMTIVTSDLRHEFIAGLQHYFNQVIGSQLLYKFERLQYAELLKQHSDKRLSDVYGSIHLLRLFVKLREMVSSTRVDPGSLALLETLTSEFLAFLHQNRKQYFRLENYTVATAEYQRRAMC